MLEMLAEYGILSTIINAIVYLYDNTEAIIITSDGETEFFKISNGRHFTTLIIYHNFRLCNASSNWRKLIQSRF